MHAQTAQLIRRYGTEPPEYGYNSIEQWDGDLSDYLAECDAGEECPESEVPIIHARDGAQVIRHTCYPSGKYAYELYWSDGRLVTEPVPDQEEFEAQVDVIYDRLEREGYPGVTGNLLDDPEIAAVVQAPLTAQDKPDRDVLKAHGTQIQWGLNYEKYEYRGQTWGCAWCSPCKRTGVAEGHWLVFRAGAGQFVPVEHEEAEEVSP